MNTAETAMGIGENIVGALTYLFGWIMGWRFYSQKKKIGSSDFTPSSRSLYPST